MSLGNYRPETQPAPATDFDDPRYHVEGRAANLPADARLGPGGFEPGTVTELAQVAQLAVQGGYAPIGTTVQGAMLAIAKGREVGLPALYSLQNIAVVNGKPAIFGDAMLGIVYRARHGGQPLLVDIHEGFEQKGDGNGEDGVTAFCEVHRQGTSPVRRTFSVREAKTANLWKKRGPWSDYPRRMLQMRARGFALRDAFADVLGGLVDFAEANDYVPFEPGEIKPRSERETEVDPFSVPFEHNSEPANAVTETQRRLDAALAVNNNPTEEETQERS